MGANLIPQRIINPVVGATNNSWNRETFWYYPWGESVVHKGIDVFAPEGTPVMASQRGLIVYKGEINRGGKIVIILGPSLRFHYYAHLQQILPDLGLLASQGDTIGFVGTTGNAVATPSHLHYTIFTPVPYPWRWSNEVQGWRKMFYLDPGEKIADESLL